MKHRIIMSTVAWPPFDAAAVVPDAVRGRLAAMNIPLSEEVDDRKREMSIAP